MTGKRRNDREKEEMAGKKKKWQGKKRTRENQCKSMRKIINEKNLCKSVGLK